MSRADKVKQIEHWTDESTGYECIAVEWGWWCGYVRVPDDHPWHGKGYSSQLCDHPGCYEHTPEAVISVHGGLTYSGTPYSAEGGHWFGFDCAHCDDYVDYGVASITREGHRWTLEEVQAECGRLAKQLADRGQGEGTAEDDG